MISKNIQTLSETKPELSNLKLLHRIFALLIVTLIVMPQYFGIHIGYDITCSRALNMIIICYMLSVPMLLTLFWKTSLRCTAFYPLMMFLFVAGYTMVFRTDVKAFFQVFMEILTFFMVIFGTRYVIGYKKALKYCIGCAYFLSIYGFVEYICGQSLFLKFLSTMPNIVGNSYRSGHYRIMGPCGHSLGYGLLLLIFVAIISYDYEKDELNLFRRPVLLAMLLANIFLTGSRSTLGIALLECFILLFLSNRITLKKNIAILSISITVIAVLLILLQKTVIGKYFLGQLFSLVDQFFDTNYAARYGIDSQTLENSSNYRDALPYIFTLDWLNPLIGRGSHFSGAYVHGTYIQSIDNFYVSKYIKYAYPGLISFSLFILTSIVTLLREVILYRSPLAKVALVGVTMYFFNLWWVDALQTLKFIYLFLAIFYAWQMERNDLAVQQISINKGGSSNP